MGNLPAVKILLAGNDSPDADADAGWKGNTFLVEEERGGQRKEKRGHIYQSIFYNKGNVI